MESLEILSSNTPTKVIEFGCIPVDKVAEKSVFFENTTSQELTYRVSLTYVLNSIDRVFKVSITPTPVGPHHKAVVKVCFRPTIAGQSYTEYYTVDDTDGNNYRLTVTGQCFGPNVSLSRRKITFRICKNVTELRKEPINIINKACIESTYQWLLPLGGQGNFEITTGNCGLIRAHETITTMVHFTGMSLGVYTSELVLLVLNQEPLYVNVIAIVVLPGDPFSNINDHVFEKNWRRKSRITHLMENSLNRLSYIPSASVFERYLDFGTGSVSDVTLNISQTLCVTNHEKEEGYIQWITGSVHMAGGRCISLPNYALYKYQNIIISDPDNIFLIDPITTMIPPNESRMFTIRFRPTMDEEVYGYLMCADFQFQMYGADSVKLKHTWFRIPCIGNTWTSCTEWPTEWDCPKEVVLPPTVPTRTTYQNFMLANKLEIPMFFKFQRPDGSNFAVLPMCGIIQGRGWQIMSVALEVLTCGDYSESWDLVINRVNKARITFYGNAEISQVEVMSHGYSPNAHAMFEFPPTITGCTNYVTAYLHNLTRMEIHLRVLNSVSWFGADYCGTLVLPPKEIVKYHWWFFPKEADKVYDTTITCSCVCLIDGRPVGEITDVFIHISGFSELPDLRVLPNKSNIHDVVVGESANLEVVIYNYGSCFFTFKLYHIIDGMGDDCNGDRLELDSCVNSLKPALDNCVLKLTVAPDGSGSRRIQIKYLVLFRTEFDEIEEIQPVEKTICKIWYDGIYPTLKVKRTISVKCPVILSNHCVWSIMKVDKLNQALVDCKPNKPLDVDIYAPDLCVQSECVEILFVLGCVYQVNVPWSFRRKKICDCQMVEVQVGVSFYEMRHSCTHRQLVEINPLNGIVSPDSPSVLHLNLNYALEGHNVLCYTLSMPNQRAVNIKINIFANPNKKGILTPLRQPVSITDYLAVLDCGRVPINNLDPVIRVLWLYNPTDVFTTWRLVRGNTISPDCVIRCLLYFAEVAPLGKLAIPFAFMPTEMIDYEVTFLSSFGYNTENILVKGQGGLPNCVEVRLDIPRYIERTIRSAYRTDVIFLSAEHLTIPALPTHSLYREMISICNETDHIMRFIWLPERLANIANIVMTPCWGVIQPKCTEWITMTVYTLQEPATFTTTVACEILDLTERKRYQSNELLRRNKTEKCKQEFIITEDGCFHGGINDSPPYVEDIGKPQPFYLAMTVSISSKGQRDGYPRMLLKQMWEQVPPYDLLTSDGNDPSGNKQKPGSGNNMTMSDIVRVIDGILWDALHSKLFKNQIKFYAKEEIPTHSQLVNVMENDLRPRLSRRVTSGICDAIVNKAIFHVYGLNSKHDVSILDV